jgi:hypothetical protein
MNRRDFCSSMTGLAALAAAPSVGISQALAIQDGEVLRVRVMANAQSIACEIPRVWRRSELIIQRSLGGPGSSEVGDPCVVRDDDIDGWRMFLFFDPPGCGHAICPQGLDPGPGHWKLEGPLVFTNPQDLMSGYSSTTTAASTARSNSTPRSPRE